MIDEKFKIYLIEANTNPCLEICCPLLARIIPELLDNSLRIAVDPLYQPPAILNDEKIPTFTSVRKMRQTGIDCNNVVPNITGEEKTTDVAKLKT